MPRNVLPRLLFCVFTALPTFAVSIVVDPNPIVTASSIANNLTGAELAGLIVTANYATPTPNPITVTAVWTPTGPMSGAATNGALSVSVTGNPSGTLAWQYSSILLSPLMSLQFDGTAAGVYFDRAHSGPGTPGSGPGADISFGPLFPSGVDQSIVVTYSSTVSLNGTPPQDDLYAKLTISFAGLPTGGLIPQDFAFTQPTDRNITPEPTSFVLIVAGSAALLTQRKAFSRNRLQLRRPRVIPLSGDDSQLARRWLL